ncbi:SDR family NAD(P)-dependent oxidoreductase [Acinetobacter lactucae]|uniref:SDR family NAD(P)-dependent oxidoreductase n=1 Tax=Acinetobacter lactucae TaxID=1785128 RepID=UPI00226AD27A|nr:SDR family NAD(P)-dependent oxidoreductase [Acinetobacter lactucae]
MKKLKYWRLPYEFSFTTLRKKALVTGGSKGTGAAVVRALHEVGAEVMTAARHPVRDLPQNVHFIEADLTTAKGCSELVQAVQKHWGKIDIVVHVLGGSSAPAGGFAVLGDEEWEREINLNLMPAIRLDRALIPLMLEQGSGVIIHVTSIQRELPLPESTTAYAAAKAAYLHIVKVYLKRFLQREYVLFALRRDGLKPKLLWLWQSVLHSKQKQIMKVGSKSL